MQKGQLQVPQPGHGFVELQTECEAYTQSESQNVRTVEKKDEGVGQNKISGCKRHQYGQEKEIKTPIPGAIFKRTTCKRAELENEIWAWSFCTSVYGKEITMLVMMFHFSCVCIFNVFLQVGLRSSSTQAKQTNLVFRGNSNR